MNNNAILGFKSILEESLQSHGWDIPKNITHSITTILADKIDKNPWQPEPSYAERYLTIKTRQEAIDLGNTCFFTRAVFPELGERRGINPTYYVSIGQGCYDRALSKFYTLELEQLRDHFEFLAEVTYTAVREFGNFRSMWE